MSDIRIRQAVLDDAAAISALFRERISAWQRLTNKGQVEDVPYDALTIYERWMHGGAWMSIETASIHLGHLLLGAGITLVAELDGQIAAYAEAYHSAEPAPFGTHLCPAHIIVSSNQINFGFEDALLKALLTAARELKCERLTAVSVSAQDVDLYAQLGLQPLAHARRFTLPARTGQIFYKANDHRDESAAQINGWFMPIGRVSSARQQWELIWRRTWDALEEIRSRSAYRLRLSAAGQDAFVCCQPQLFNPRALDVYCWSPKPLTTQLLASIRDWSHKEGYRTLAMTVSEETIKLLGAEAEPDGYSVDIYSLNV